MTTYPPVPGHKMWCTLNDEYVVDANKPRECSCQRVEDLAWLEGVFTYFAKSGVELARSMRIMRELTCSLDRTSMAAGSEPVNISAILWQLLDVMDECCDQPLSVDRMTLTRSWRGILEAASFSVLPPMVTPDDMRWVELAGYDCEASRRILAALEWVHQQQAASPEDTE
jgi:hypothetical protein